MSGIIWLASYPKSGNTWLRIFLANLMSTGTEPYDINALRYFAYSDTRAALYERASGKAMAELTDEHLHRLRPLVHRFLAARKEERVFVKTHNAIAVRAGIPTITPDTTAGAIYVIRNPMDVSISYAHHFAMDMDAAVEALSSPDNLLATVDRTAVSFLGSWSGHVQSWADASGLNTHVVRYEDMLAKPMQTFRAIAEHLGLAVRRDDLKRAIKFSAFEQLKSQEAKDGFRERGPAGGTFFREGRTGQWRQCLTPKQVDAMVASHGAVMERYGYLT